MKIDAFVRCLLLLITIFLGMIALRPYVAPPKVEAQAGGAYPVWIAPNLTNAIDANGGAVWGKVVIDLRNGNMWFFPGVQGANRPVSPGGAVPTSHPFLVGKWALGDLDK